MLMLSPTLAAVDANQPALMRLLKTKGIDSLPVLLRHGRTLSGGPHCITLDTRRTGTLESYF
jgi:glycine amidinotransferase